MKRILLTCLIAALGGSIFAQSPKLLTGRHNGSLGLQANGPVRDFKSQIPEPFGGLYIQYRYRFNGLPKLSLGGELSVANLAFQRWEDWNHSEDPDRFRVLYERSSNMLTLDLLLRYEPGRLWKFYPFAELKGGWNAFLTDEKTYDPHEPRRKKAELSSELIHSDVTRNWALSLGATLPVIKGPALSGKYLGLEGSLSWMPGGTASYMLDQAWRTVQSGTSMWLFRLGLVGAI